LKSCNKNCKCAVLFGILAIFLRATAGGETGGAVTAAGIEHDIAVNGASSVVKQLRSGKGTAWQDVLRNVETGRVAWLRVAQQLLKGTDAGNTESLYFAVSLALTRNPEAVLPMLGPEIPAGKICTVPYIEPSEKTEREYRAKARAALDRIAQPELTARKEMCLKELAVGEK